MLCNVSIGFAAVSLKGCTRLCCVFMSVLNTSPPHLVYTFRSSLPLTFIDNLNNRYLFNAILTKTTSGFEQKKKRDRLLALKSPTSIPLNSIDPSQPLQSIICQPVDFVQPERGGPP